jgi:hypothetical protein
VTDDMPHKRSPTGQQKREEKKSMRKQAYTYIHQNSFHDLQNGETVNRVTPEQVKNFLISVNGEAPIRIVSPRIFGSLIFNAGDEHNPVQAAQGLVLEGTIKY